MCIGPTLPRSTSCHGVTEHSTSWPCPFWNLYGAVFGGYGMSNGLRPGWAPAVAAARSASVAKAVRIERHAKVIIFSPWAVRCDDSSLHRGRELPRHLTR